MKGHYVCQYVDENNDSQTIDLNTKWVEANFNNTLLSYAQKQAYDSLKPVQIKKDNGQLTTKYRFVDVTSENITIVLDNTAFHKIWYIPAQTHTSGNLFKKDKEGNFIFKDGQRVKNDDRTHEEHPEKWVVYSDITKKSQSISELDLLKFATPKFLDLVKSFSMQGKKKWIEIPPGDNKKH